MSTTHGASVNRLLLDGLVTHPAVQAEHAISIPAGQPGTYVYTARCTCTCGWQGEPRPLTSPVVDAYPEIRDHLLTAVAKWERVDPTMVVGHAPTWRGTLADLLQVAADLGTLPR